MVRFLQDYANAGLMDLERADTSDAEKVQDKVRIWKIREAVFQAIQAEVLQAIEAKEKWLEDAKNRSLPPIHPEFATIEEQYAGPDTNDPSYR